MTDPFSPKATIYRGTQGIAAIDWLLVLLGKLQRGLIELNGEPRIVRQPPLESSEPVASAPCRPLKRILVAEEAARCLFDEYASHRATERGDEETGWLLLGRREAEEAVVLATLPAGADREAGAAHVRFNSCAQAVAGRIVRQTDKRLTILGVVHTHPGSLRHPSDGDFRGDIDWVSQLRGGEGIFGIGTADCKNARPPAEIWQPRSNMQCRGAKCFTWYSLRTGWRAYRALPVEIVPGADRAGPLRSIWPILEKHAGHLDRLAIQQARTTFDIFGAPGPPTVALSLPLADGMQSLRLMLSEKEIRYYLVRGDGLLAADMNESNAERGVYRLLAELAGDD